VLCAVLYELSCVSCVHCQQIMCSVLCGALREPSRVSCVEHQEGVLYYSTLRVNCVLDTYNGKRKQQKCLILVEKPPGKRSFN
jgi:hypothetical protein